MKYLRIVYHIIIDDTEVRKPWTFSTQQLDQVNGVSSLYPHFVTQFGNARVRRNISRC